MWSYYGSKRRLAKYYPHPRHTQIIEPFAGAAAYSLLHWRGDVLLVDKYPVVVKLWQWLQKQEPETILALPRLKEGDLVSALAVSEEAGTLLGFIAMMGRASPTDKATSHHSDWTNTTNYQLSFIARNLYKIRHWQIVCDDYRNLENRQATWFIDPPYQHGGEYYVMNNKGWDYAELAEWCRSREGQVIVCENTKSDWLPFAPMRKLQGSKHQTTEAIWTNYPTHYDARQLELFA